MTDLFEISLYILMQLAKKNTVLFIILLGLVSYLGYKGLKIAWPFVQKFSKFLVAAVRDPRKILIQLKSLKKVETLRKVLLWLPTYIGLWLGNLLFRLVYTLPFIGMKRKRFNKEVKPILAFKTFQSFIYMGLGFSFLAFLLTSYLVTVLRAIIPYLYFMVLSIKDESLYRAFDWTSLLIQNLLNAQVFVLAPILAFPILTLGLIAAWRSAWINFEQYRDYNHNEEGDDRFATTKEIHQQYKKVPNKRLTYPGDGGVPVLHETRKNLAGVTLASQMKWQNRTVGRYIYQAQRILGNLGQVSGDYYIEDATVNLLDIGITRSGKGEGRIAPIIDINSRAEKQPSMVISDPKGEHYQSSYKTMRKRGYDVEVLSFQNMDWSMSYNPLELAIAAAKRGYYEKAQTRVNAVSEAIFPQPKGGGKGNSEYFRKSSISLFNALTMALIDRANETFKNGEEDAWDTITIHNIAKFLANLGSEDVFVDSDGEIVENPEKGQSVWKKSKLTVYFDNLRKVNQKEFSKFRQMADMEFRASDFGGDETKGNVYSSMMTGINLFLQDNVAKLTSKNSIDLESVGFPRRLSVKLRSSRNRLMENEFTHKIARITIKDAGTGKPYVQNATALIDAEGYLTYCIEPKLPDQFVILIDFDHDNNGTSAIRSVEVQFSAEKIYGELDSYTGKPTLKGVNIRIDEASQSLIQEQDVELIYSDNPKIIYLVTPPNRTEYNSIVSLFLDQLFNANYELALSNGRKCINRILHVLDEFTNMPAVPNMDTKISIGLGQNILYYLWIQNLEQLVAEYGENVAKTIQDNCSLQVYIKSTSQETNERFSKRLGSRTITRRRRSSNILDEANPNVSVDHVRQELLTPTQLAKLQEGEAVILRGVKGRNNQGHKVTTDPIFLHDKTSLPYRYMFLQEEFDQFMTLADIPVESEHRNLNLQDVAIDGEGAFKNLIDWRHRFNVGLGSNTGESPKLAGRGRTQIQGQPQAVQSTEELFEAAVASVIGGDVLPGYEESFLDDDFFVDDVM